jgi:hypothetical protein
MKLKYIIILGLISFMFSSFALNKDGPKHYSGKHADQIEMKNKDDKKKIKNEKIQKEKETKHLNDR